MKKPLILKDNDRRFGLGYRPSHKDYIRVQEERKECRIAHLQNRDPVSKAMEILYLRVSFLFLEGLRDQKNSWCRMWFKTLQRLSLMCQKWLNQKRCSQTYCLWNTKERKRQKLLIRVDYSRIWLLLEIQNLKGLNSQHWVFKWCKSKRWSRIWLPWCTQHLEMHL